MLAFAALGVALALVRAAYAAAPPPLNISFPLHAPAGAPIVQDNFLGISWELSAFNTLWGEGPDTLPPAMQNYLANIRARMSAPLRIRVGGNSMDGSVYAPDQPEMISLLDPDAYFNDVPVSFGPVLFDVLNAMAARVGGMQFMLGLSMRDPAEDENVVLLAEAIRARLGDQLDAMLLGNEPDLYANHGNRLNYTIADYIPEVGKVLNDLRSSSQGNLLNTTIIGGPTVCCSWALSDVLKAGLSSYPYRYYTIQHYPNNVCSGSTPASANISYYLTHANVAPFIAWNADGMALANATGVPVALTEYNSASCGGDPAVAPTFAAALWALDAALQGAAAGLAAAYLHTREAGITYNLFDPPAANSTGAGWRTGAVYYAPLVAAEAFSPRGSAVADLTASLRASGGGGGGGGGGGDVAAYGIWDGGARGKLALFNFADAGGAPRAFALPANISHGVGVRMLLAPGVREQRNISWAGQTAGGDGALAGVQGAEFQRCADGCVVEVPGPGMALVFIDPRSNMTDNIFFGNTTVDTGSGSAEMVSASGGAARWKAGWGVVLGWVGALAALIAL